MAAYVVPPLALCAVHGERPAVQARGHLEGLDELGGSDATGALRHDPCEAHLSLQVDLKFWKKTRRWLDPFIVQHKTSCSV